MFSVVKSMSVILGTVIVEPEAVEETKRDEYKGPEWKATKRLSRSGMHLYELVTHFLLRVEFLHLNS